MLAACIALLGFSERYFLALAAGTLEIAALVHIHGMIMFAWVALFLTQATLAATGRMDGHRALGLAGIALFALVLWTGIEVAILQLARDIDAGNGDVARRFAIFPLSLMVATPVLFALAIAARRRPATHQRLMLLTTLFLLNPAIARVFALAGAGPRPENPVYGGIVVLCLIGVAVAFDVRRYGRPHVAYVYGGSFIAAVQVARATLGDTEAWFEVTDALFRLTR